MLEITHNRKVYTIQIVSVSAKVSLIRGDKINTNNYEIKYKVIIINNNINKILEVGKRLILAGCTAGP